MSFWQISLSKIKNCKKLGYFSELIKGHGLIEKLELLFNNY